MGKRLKKVAELATKFSVSGMTDIQKQPLVRIIRTTIFCSIYTGHCSMTIKAFHPRFQDGILNLLEKMKAANGQLSDIYCASVVSGFTKKCLASNGWGDLPNIYRLIYL